MKSNCQFVLVVDGHAVGLHVDSGSVFVVDDAHQRVLSTIVTGLIRELAEHSAVMVVPVSFGDPKDGAAHLSDTHMSVSAGAAEARQCLVINDQAFRSSEAFIMECLYAPPGLHCCQLGMRNTIANLQHFRVLLGGQYCPKCKESPVVATFGPARNPMFWGCALNRSHKHFMMPIRVNGPMSSISVSNLPAFLHYVVCMRGNMRMVTVRGGCLADVHGIVAISGARFIRT